MTHASVCNFKSQICNFGFQICHFKSQIWNFKFEICNLRLFVAAAVLLCVPAFSRADISVSFSLKGFYRPGRYIPVQVTAHESTRTSLSLSGPGVVPTDLPISSNSNIIAPLLLIHPSAGISWSIPGQAAHDISIPLRALSDDEGLIGYAGGDVDALKDLFKGKKLVGVALDLSQPLAGPAAAWESLDGVVLDAQAAARINQVQLQQLLTTGMAVAIRSPVKPAGAWPWKQAGAYWIVCFPISGPTSAFVPGGYAPVSAWSRGWPLAFRRQVVLAAILFSILAMGVTLWRSRWAIALLVLLSAGCVAGIIAWRDRQPVTLQVGGTILVLGDAGAQEDRWTYCTVMRSADQTIEWQGLAHPIFATRAQIAQMPVQLVCDGNGEPQAFRCSIEPGRSLAFLSRSISPQSLNISPANPVTSPMRSLAQELYERQGEPIEGQLGDGTPDRWPSVCVNGAEK